MSGPWKSLSDSDGRRTNDDIMRRAEGPSLAVVKRKIRKDSLRAATAALPVLYKEIVFYTNGSNEDFPDGSTVPHSTICKNPIIRKIMKFCKSLQRVVEISDPDWGPYWLNYKYLKRLIKDLRRFKTMGSDLPEDVSPNTTNTGNEMASSRNKRKQQKGEITASSASDNQNTQWLGIDRTERISRPKEMLQDSIGNSPGEVIFFKTLHAELKKAEFFFNRASDEMAIREERVRNGMHMIQRQTVLPVNKEWGTMSRAIYRLYKDLLLLESFAILNYVGFSKILKKHDKTTGKRTCGKFMETIVNKASFTRYPRLMSMISKCEGFYNEVSTILERDGKKALSEDEHLFISMIHRLNEQVLESNEVEKPPRTLAKFPCTRLDSQATSSFCERLEEDEKKPAAKLFRSGTGSSSASCASEDDHLGQALKPAAKRSRLS